MTAGASVRSLRALDEWKSSLKRFVDDTQVALESAEHELRGAEDWLQQRVSHWQRELEEAQEEVWHTRRALEECRSEDDNCCDVEEEELAEARRHLSNSEAELENARRWTHQVQDAAQRYRAQASRLRILLQNDMGRADAILDTKISDLRRYLAAAAPRFSDAQKAGQPQGTETWKIQGQGIELQKLNDALWTLARTVNGKAIAEAVLKNHTTVSFGRTLLDGEKGNPPLARYFPPPRNDIVIREELKGRSRNVIAAHLAHEGTHVQWRPRPNSLNQEYHAFMAEARVWLEVRGNEKDPVCDSVVEKIYNKSEAEAKRYIYQQYKSAGIDLSENA